MLSRAISTRAFHLGFIIVPQQTAVIIERLGKYNRTLTPGINFAIPFIEKDAYYHSLKEEVYPISSQMAITNDNVTIHIDGVLYLRITDPYSASYGIGNPIEAMTQLAQTTMRSELGKLSLDKTFEERESLNHNIVTALNSVSKQWGIQCMRYEIRDIQTPPNIQKAMELQAESERQKRAEILNSEGTRQANINTAEGKRQSFILKAEGDANAILAKSKATAEGIRILSESVKRQGGINAMRLRVTEQYISAFSKIASTNKSIIVPGGGISSTIAQVLGINKALDGKQVNNQVQTVVTKERRLDPVLDSSEQQKMDNISIFAFAMSNFGEVVLLVRRDQDHYRNLGGETVSDYSPLHSVVRHYLRNTRGLMAPANIKRLIDGEGLVPENDGGLVWEILEILVKIPSFMIIKNLGGQIGYLMPVQYIDPEILNTNLTDTSLHWIRVSTLFSVEEYQQFFFKQDLEILSQVNTHMLQEYISKGKEPVQRIRYYIGVINLEQKQLKTDINALLLTQLLKHFYCNYQVKWIFFEDQLPDQAQQKLIGTYIVIGLKHHKFRGLGSFLKHTIQAKKIIAIGSGAEVLCSILDGVIQEGEEAIVPELTTINLTDDYNNLSFVNEEQKETELIIYSNQIVREAPEGAIILATSHDTPCIYIKDNVLLIHGHPYLNYKYIEEILGPELLDEIDGSEQQLDNMKNEWNLIQDPRFGEIKHLCESFIIY